MRPVLRVMRLILGAAPWAMARGAALSVVVLLMGAALLGLSGWFIVATGIAGLAGIGIAFDVFRPSAGVRFLALGRTAARYGERLLTHDATLRALAALRVALLRDQAQLDAHALSRLRSEAVLTRIVSDVDALDGLVLRLVLPAFAALVTQFVVFGAVIWLIGWPVALAILAGYLPFAVLIFWISAARAIGPSDDAERQTQSLRRGVIDMIRDREALILSGRLSDKEESLISLNEAARQVARDLDRTDRGMGISLSALVTCVVAVALVVGGRMTIGEGIGPARVVIGVFVALALAETVLPLRRGFADLGRMVGAAKRVAPGQRRQFSQVRHVLTVPPELEVARSDLSFRVGAGQALALTGPSGSGKSTLLNAIAGLGEPLGITIGGRSPADWDEASFRSRVTLLPQRSSLMAGTIRENLLLASRGDDSDLMAALDAAALTDTIAARGGLDMRLGEGGKGLSGGEARRLTVARALLRRPDLLLLDEPTVGLDPFTSDQVLTGIRHYLPDAAIVVALHNGADHPIFDQVIQIGNRRVTNRPGFVYR